MPYFVSLRHLIREMSVANPLWGAPRIHGELLKLAIDVGQTTVANEKAATVARLGRPSFAITPDGIASIDLSVVPTISFRLRYGLLVLRRSRRELLWLGHPSTK